MSPAVEKPPPSQGVAYGIVLGQLITSRRVYELIILSRLRYRVCIDNERNHMAWSKIFIGVFGTRLLI